MYFWSEHIFHAVHIQWGDFGNNEIVADFKCCTHISYSVCKIKSEQPIKKTTECDGNMEKTMNEYNVQCSCAILWIKIASCCVQCQPRTCCNTIEYIVMGKTRHIFLQIISVHFFFASFSTSWKSCRYV